MGQRELVWFETGKKTGKRNGGASGEGERKRRRMKRRRRKYLKFQIYPGPRSRQKEKLWKSKNPTEKRKVNGLWSKNEGKT